MSDTREDARDEARRLIYGDDIDQHGQPIWSPLEVCDEWSVTSRLAWALSQTLREQGDLFATEMTAVIDVDALYVTAWAKDSTGRTVSKDYVLEVREA